MRVIQPNCRIQFTSEDIDFIVSVLGSKTGPSDCLTRLLADEETRDLILDDESLFRALLESSGCLRVSCRLYFYVLVRNVLRRAGIEDREVADYVAELLCEFSRSENSDCKLTANGERLDYFFEMISALESADERTSFYIRTYIGNRSLFLSGVFPEWIQQRAETRGFPNLHYYETLGEANYRAVCDHRLAKRYAVAPVLATLADRFQATRIALNDLTQRLFSLDDSDFPVESFLPSG